MPKPMERDRRRHGRRALRLPLAVRADDGARSIPCESLDVSVGGMRVRSQARVPLGACEVVINATADDLLVLEGRVVDEVIDATSGEVTARIVFRDVVPAPHRVLLTLPADPARPPHAWPRRAAVAGGVAAGIVVIAGLALASSGRDDEPDASVREAARPAPAFASSPIDAPARALSRGGAPEAAAPVASPAPAPTPSAPVQERPASAGGGSLPGPASPNVVAVPVARTERADNAVRVSLAPPDDTRVASTVGPSEGVDEVRVQLNVTPDDGGFALPVQVTVENRGEATLTFPGGFEATVAATRDGAPAASVTLRSDVTEVAPGQTVSVDGILDFGGPGEYDVTAETVVAG